MRHANHFRSHWSLGLLVAALVAQAPSSARGAAHIVQDGKPCADIVIAEQPPRTVKLAAGELQGLIERISGARLPIATAPGGEFPAHIYLGRSAHTDRLKVTDEGLTGDGFRMVSGDNWLVLLGPDAEYAPVGPWARAASDRVRAQEEWDKLTGARWANPGVSTFKGYNATLQIWEQDGRGSLNAVYEFLRSLGARWYMPGEFGQALPDARTIPLPKVNRTVQPDFGYRHLGFYGNAFFQAPREEALWQLRLGMRATGGIGGHGIDGALHHDKTRAAHPEFFMMVNGKRDLVSRGGKPCLSSEGLLRNNVEYARALFRIYNPPIVSVMPTDGYAALCQCDLCKGKDTPARGYEGLLSDYVWGYVDRVAQALRESDPDKKVTCFAYSAYMLPPERIGKLSPNVVVGICQGRADFHNPETRDKHRQLRQAWLSKVSSGKLYTWDYYLHGRPGKPFEGLPVYFPHLVSEDLKSLKGICAGEGIEVYRSSGAPAPDPALATNHLNCYVTARLWWDAEQDVDALLGEYYTLFYGPAARAMKAYVDYCEAHWPRMVKDVEAIDKSVELLTAAQQAAGDTIYGKRVALVAEYTRPVRQLREKLAAGRDDARPARVYPRAAAGITLDGRLNKPFWEGMAVYGLTDLVTGAKPKYATTFQVAWGDDNALYFGILCREPDMKDLNIGTDRPEDPNIWNGDCIEILLETQGHAYYQVAIGPTGALTDLDRREGANLLWASGARAVAFRGEDFWSLEVRIPVAPELQEQVDPNNGVAGRKMSSVQPWYFNLCRQRIHGADREFTAFSPTGKVTFHDAMKFGKLYMR
jgi:hypothetical protein